MKKLFVGLLSGILISGAACYLYLPNVKQTAYESGYNTGNKDGIAAGIMEGRKQEIAEVAAKHQHQRDTLATVRKNRETTLRNAAQKHKPAPKPVQNWHVIDGKIQEPITDSLQQ